MTRASRTRRIGAAAAAALAALAAGCSLAPAYERPALPVAAAYPTGPAYATAAGATTLPAADVGWRDFLADARLRRLVETALRNNRDLRVAVLNVARVRAEYRIQRAGLVPQVSAYANGARSRTPRNLVSGGGAAETGGTWAAGVAAAWEIDFFGRLRNLADAAFEQYLASAQARNAAEILLVSQVADQYLTLLALDDSLAVTDHLLEAARASYALVRLQFDAGTASELALRQAQTVVEQARANRAAQMRLRAQAENALVLLLGEPLPADLPPPVPMGAQRILADIPAGLPSDLLARRPDILQAEALLRAENANIGAARAAFFPRITLTGSAGTASAALSGLFEAGSAAWAFVPALTQPIFEGGALSANLDLAWVQKNIGIAQYEKSIQSAFREVADGLAARGTYDDEVAALERYVNAQRRALELAELTFKAGTASYLEVLSARTSLYNGQLALVSARLQRLTSLVDLYRALGGGWIERTGDPPRTTGDDQSCAKRCPGNG
jgi:multidrug efflux system outer membrane protein